MRRRRWYWLGSIVIAALALVWMLYERRGGDEPSSAAVASTEEIRIPILASSALQTLDPIKSTELVQYNLSLQIYECLVAVGKRGEIVPALAESWEPSRDFTIWTLRLRDAHFADDEAFPGGTGRQVTADDVIYSWKRGLSPALGSLNSWALSAVVEGAEAFAKGQTGNVSGLERVDGRTVRVRLTRPDRDFLARLTVLSTAVVPREAVDRYGEQFGSHPVGTGPFVLKEWAAGQYLVLERSHAYGRGGGWQPRIPAIARARFIFFRSESQIANEFRFGTIDVRDVAGGDLVGLADISSVEELQKSFPDAQLIRPGTVSRLHLLAPLIGNDYAFGASAELRRLLAISFDREQLVKSALGPLGNTTTSLILPPEIILDAPPVRDSTLPPPDPSAAAVLAGRTVKVAYVSSRIGDVTVALLQSWLEQRGATVRLFPSASINALFASVGEVRPDLTLIYWSPYFPNLPNFLVALLSSSRPVPNFTGFSNRELDEAADLLSATTGNEAIKVRLDIKEILDREMPWIPLYYDNPLMLVKRHVRNFAINPVSVMLLNEVHMEAAAPLQTRKR